MPVVLGDGVGDVGRQDGFAVRHGPDPVTMGTEDRPSVEQAHAVIALDVGGHIPMMKPRAVEQKCIDAGVVLWLDVIIGPSG